MGSTCPKPMARATAAQAGSDKETPIYMNTIIDIMDIESQNFDIIGKPDIEGAFFNIDKSPILEYTDIEVKDFNI